MLFLCGALLLSPLLFYCGSLLFPSVPFFSFANLYFRCLSFAIRIGSLPFFCLSFAPQIFTSPFNCVSTPCVARRFLAIASLLQIRSIRRHSIALLVCLSPVLAVPLLIFYKLFFSKRFVSILCYCFALPFGSTPLLCLLRESKLCLTLASQVISQPCLCRTDPCRAVPLLFLALLIHC